MATPGESTGAAVHVVLYQYLHLLVCTAGKERSKCTYTYMLRREFKGCAGSLLLIVRCTSTTSCKGTREQKKNITKNKCQQNPDFLLVLQYFVPKEELFLTWWFFVSKAVTGDNPSLNSMAKA